MLGVWAGHLHLPQSRLAPQAAEAPGHWYQEVDAMAGQQMKETLVEAVGAGAILYGVSLWSPAAAFVLGGIMMVVMALVIDLTRRRRP